MLPHFANPDCRPCKVAQVNPDTGEAFETCRGCMVRLCSKLPRDRRTAMLSEIEAEQGADAARRFFIDVQAEFTRRQAHRRMGT